MDDSHNIRGLLVNIFTETQEKLPQVEASGDIIQLSQVVVPQLLSPQSLFFLLILLVCACKAPVLAAGVYLVR